MRQWLASACNGVFKVSIITWKKIFQSIRNSSKSGSATSKIACCTLHLTNSKCIINDLYLLCAFQTLFSSRTSDSCSLGMAKQGTLQVSKQGT